ncbi:Hsp70 family protein [Mycobacterium sp. 3519A]|uniref:Hsp70 family protein n=1 Tax=Mycobacterium sp. 3519A TaxID=2057184 RepID=UPI000C7C12BE|nr:Hsp70 family protein [Mycobacterium sp. 3519A]
MLNSPGNHGRSIGLSVGATNLAGTRDGYAAILRPAELTLHGQRLTGFVDRVGDPVPLIAPDGATYRSERLLADALAAMADAITDGLPVTDAAVTVPAHWRPSIADILRRNLRGKLPVVSDATAALTALRNNPGLPTHGVIVLCDFGGSGTSITLANAARDFSVFGETVRFCDFSGDLIDQALLAHVVGGLADIDPSGTAMVGSLVRLRDECRRAKERLSAETATAVVADLPGQRADIRVTRTELEDLMRAPLTDFLAALDDTLERYGVPAASVTAVATVGGGARIPLITQRLSEHLRAPVVTTRSPALTAAEGAALIAHRSRVVDEATVLTPTATALVPAAQPLAWSEGDVSQDVLPYSDATQSRPEVSFRREQWRDDEPPRRSPLVLFGLSAVAAAVAAAVFGFTLLNDTATTPVDAASTSTTTTTPQPPAAPATLPATPAPQAPQITTVVVQQPAPRFQAPRRVQPQAPVPHQPPVAPPPTSETPETPEPTDPTPPPTSETPPTSPEPPTSPKPPPIDPGPGDGSGTGTGTGGTETGGTGTGTETSGPGSQTGAAGTGDGGTSTTPEA